MIYLIAHFFVFLVPGWLLVSILNIRHNGLLLAISFSTTVLLAIVMVARWYGLPIDVVITIYCLLVVILFFVAWWCWRQPYGSTIVALEVFANNHKQQSWSVLFGAAVLVISIVVYYLWAGPYDEIPADRFRHLEYAQVVFNDLSDGRVDAVVSIKQWLGKSALYWYYFHAMLAKVTAQDIAQSAYWAELSNVITLMLGVYFFGLSVFRSQPRHVVVKLALIASAIFFVHKGIGTFAYVRNYALAPTMINLVLYFAIIATILNTLKIGKTYVADLLIIFLLCVTAYLLHTQEALFAVLFGTGLYVYGYFYKLMVIPTSDLKPSVVGNYSEGIKTGFIRNGWLAVAGVGGLIFLFFYSRLHSVRNWVPADNKLISLPDYLPSLPQIYILNPSYQFLQTISYWGLLVLIVAGWHFRKLLAQPYLVVGLLIPIATVFNPFFVDLFLRHSGYVNLWRFSYLLPLSFLASYLLLLLWQNLSTSAGWKKSNTIVVMVLLLALLLPGSASYWQNPYSRIQSMIPVKERNSPRQWQDLLDFMDTISEPTFVLTDPVTGYVISALTHHHSFREKFFARHYKEINFPSYDNRPLKQYQDWLVIVNNRDGAYSDSGAVNGHWDTEINYVSRYYSDELIKHLKQNPQFFAPIWSSDNIWVYRIIG